MENVLEKVCAEKHENIRREQDTQNTRINSHSDKIDSLEKAIAILTDIVGRLEKQEEAVWEGQERRQKKSKVYEQKWFSWVIMTGCAVLFVLVSAAVGKEYFTEAIETIIKLKLGG